MSRYNNGYISPTKRYPLKLVVVFSKSFSERKVKKLGNITMNLLSRPEVKT